MEPIELLSSHSAVYDCNDISEESDDADTPLQVWQRLVGKYQPEAKVCETLKDDTSKDISVATKRKSRRRVQLRDTCSSIAIYDESSSADEEADKLKPPKRRLRSRKNKVVANGGSKSVKNRSTGKSKATVQGKISKKKPDDCLSGTADMSPAEELDVPSTSFVPLRRSKRRSGRSSVRKIRKIPIEFTDDNSMKRRRSKKISSSDEETCDDSQRTILLDTPELLDDTEVLGNAENSDSDVESDEKCGCPESSKNVEDNDQISHEKEQQSLILKKCSPIDKNFNKNTFIESSKEPDGCGLNIVKDVKKKLPVAKPSEMQSTELDEIFFQSHSPKKPPPGRRKEQLGNSSATSALDSATQESTCSSLWDDDTLWVAK